MTYTTKASEGLVDAYRRVSTMNADRAAKSTDTFERGLRQGWADALTFAAECATNLLPDVEAEARLVPEDDAAIEWLREQMSEAENRFAYGDR